MEILKREIVKDGDNFVVLENTKKTYTRVELINELQNIQRQKAHFAEQSKRIKQEYDSLTLKENELKLLLEESVIDNFEEI